MTAPPRRPIALTFFEHSMPSGFIHKFSLLSLSSGADGGSGAQEQVLTGFDLALTSKPTCLPVSRAGREIGLCCVCPAHPNRVGRSKPR